MIRPCRVHGPVGDHGGPGRIEWRVYDSDRHVVNGPISKIDPGVRRTVVAVPADTPPKSIVGLDRDTHIITGHFVEIERYGGPERSLRHKPVSRRSIDVAD